MTLAFGVSLVLARPVLLRMAVVKLDDLLVPNLPLG